MIETDRPVAPGRVAVESEVPSIGMEHTESGRRGPNAPGPVGPLGAWVRISQ